MENTIIEFKFTVSIQKVHSNDILGNILLKILASVPSTDMISRPTCFRTRH